MKPIRYSFLVFASVAFFACGGSVEHVPGAASNANGNANPQSGGGSGDPTCNAVPLCNDGDQSYTSSEKACIETVGLSCYERTACGSTIWCQHSDNAQCDGYPECPAGYGEVKSCLASDVDCQKFSACGVTIYCQKAVPPCEGPMPICDPGDKQVSSQSECVPNGTCYSRSVCNYTIWCTEGE